MLNFFFLAEPVALSHLLQSAFLLAQQLERGSYPYEAFLNTVTDVYYKSRTPNEFSVSDFETLLRAQIKELLNDKNTSINIYNNRATININHLQSFSEIEKVQQQAALLKNTNCDLSFLYLLIQVYSVTSREDFKTRRLFLQHSLRKTHILTAKQINRSINDFLTQIDLPQDSRWLPDAIYKKKNLSNSNKIMLSMFLAVNSDLCRAEKRGLLIEYMENVRLKKLEDKIDDTIVATALDLFEKYDGFLKNTTKSNIAISDEQLIQTLSLYRWRNVFYKSTFVNIPKLNTIQFQEMLAQIHIHYKWFSKYGIHKLVQVLNTNIDEALKELVLITDGVLIHEFSTIRKLAKNYQKLIHPPPPLINNTQLTIIPAFHEISEKLNLYNKRNNFEAVLTVLSLRSDVINLSVQLNFDFCELPVAFEDLRNGIAASNEQRLSIRTQLLPVEDYFVRLQLLKMRNNWDLNAVGNLLQKSVTIPCGLAGSCLRYKQTSDVRLEHEINTEFYNYLINCAVRCPGKFLKHQEDVVLSLFSPSLSYVVTELLVPRELYGCLVSYLDTKKQLRILNAVLWRNMKQLSLLENDYL